MVPKEYYDPTILKEDVYVPCLAGQTLPLCAHYTYPDLYGNPQVMSTDAQIPGRGDEPYGVEGRDDLLSELQTRKLTPVANYQPNVSPYFYYDNHGFYGNIKNPDYKYLIIILNALFLASFSCKGK